MHEMFRSFYFWIFEKNKLNMVIDSAEIVEINRRVVVDVYNYRTILPLYTFFSILRNLFWNNSIENEIWPIRKMDREMKYWIINDSSKLSTPKIFITYFCDVYVSFKFKAMTWFPGKLLLRQYYIHSVRQVKYYLFFDRKMIKLFSCRQHDEWFRIDETKKVGLFTFLIDMKSSN